MLSWSISCNQRALAPLRCNTWHEEAAALGPVGWKVGTCAPFNPMNWIQMINWIGTWIGDLESDGGVQHRRVCQEPAERCNVITNPVLMSWLILRFENEISERSRSSSHFKLDFSVSIEQDYTGQNYCEGRWRKRMWIRHISSRHTCRVLWHSFPSLKWINRLNHAREFSSDFHWFHHLLPPETPKASAPCVRRKDGKVRRNEPSDPRRNND